ncbi:hypothetical protein C1C97_003045 [Kocuria tytonis]|uniref:Uncharacterized protein n=1 Tax=Kocuria tytonis TaxID=2054280 RepID=A0A495AB56_9MICC|nr:hypothetical protein C1C97_003045 [Kocuria tytonis]
MGSSGRQSSGSAVVLASVEALGEDAWVLVEAASADRVGETDAEGLPLEPAPVSPVPQPANGRAAQQARAAAVKAPLVDLACGIPMNSPCVVMPV